MEDTQQVEADDQTDDVSSGDDGLNEMGTDLDGNDLDDDGNGSDSAANEVFVGGLPPCASDEEVKEAFAKVGQVVSVRLNRRKKTGECKGFGFVKFADSEAAERAIAEISQVCGKNVGVSTSRGKTGDVVKVPDMGPSLDDDSDTESSISKLLNLIRSHSDEKAAIKAALSAVMTVPKRTKSGDSSDPQGGDDKSSHADAEKLEATGDVSHDQPRRKAEDDTPLPDPNNFLEAYPKCRRLVETFRSNPNTHNKTPLAILHEYATRLSLELSYEESAPSNLGPFTVEAKLSSVGGAVTYATGTGRGRGKKDAKQVGAAAVLESLLLNVAETEFLQPSKRTKGVQGDFQSLFPINPSRPAGRPVPGNRRPPRGARGNTWVPGRYTPSQHMAPSYGGMGTSFDYPAGPSWYPGPQGGFQAPVEPSMISFETGPSSTRFGDMQSDGRRSSSGGGNIFGSGYEIVAAGNAQPYQQRVLHQLHQEDLPVYGQGGPFGLGNMGQGVGGLPRPSVEIMRPPIGSQQLQGLGLSFGNVPVTAGIHDPSLGGLGPGLTDPSLQMSGHGNGQYGLSHQMPYQ
eukprot:jgi/Botrbrau1/12426/Bobra.0229s0022.1